MGVTDREQGVRVHGELFAHVLQRQEEAAPASILDLPAPVHHPGDLAPAPDKVQELGRPSYVHEIVIRGVGVHGAQ